MTAKVFKNSMNIFMSVFPRSAAISRSFLTQRLKCSYVVSRTYSLLCDLQRIKLNELGKYAACANGQIGYSTSTDRSITDSPGSQFSEEADNADKDESRQNLKKLTLDDIMAQWPDNKTVWLGYRRNHKGQIPPKTTRLRCTTVSKKLLTQNPCPICRVRVEENYEIDSKDVVFLSQFMSPHTGEVLDTKKTGVCRQQQKKLIHSIERARDQGHLPFTIPGPRDPPRQFKAAGIPAPNLRNKTG